MFGFEQYKIEINSIRRFLRNLRNNFSEREHILQAPPLSMQ